MNARELHVRQEVIRTMAGAWLPTIHVENHLNPGVPDLSFVLLPGGCETGWLELKAMVLSKKLTVKVEPGQHRWMRIHADLVPAFFLIEVSEKLHLVHGRHHGTLVDPITPGALAEMSTRIFNIGDRAQMYDALRSVTFRRLNSES